MCPEALSGNSVRRDGVGPLPGDAEIRPSMPSASQYFPRPAKAFHGLPMPSKISQDLPRSPKAFRGLPRPTNVFKGLSRPSKVCWGLLTPSRLPKAFHGPPRPSKISQGLPPSSKSRPTSGGGRGLPGSRNAFPWRASSTHASRREARKVVDMMQRGLAKATANIISGSISQLPPVMRIMSPVADLPAVLPLSRVRRIRRSPSSAIGLL